MKYELISKQSAINALENTECELLAEEWDELTNAIKQVPSEEPERPKSKWIPHREKSCEYIGTVLVNVEYDYWFCDTCGYRVENGQPIYNFCPHCGAKMEVNE